MTRVEHAEAVFLCVCLCLKAVAQMPVGPPRGAMPCRTAHEKWLRGQLACSASSSVFVRGFDRGTTRGQFVAHFSQIDEVTSVAFRGPRFAVVGFATAEAAAKAITRLNPSQISGNTNYIDCKLDRLPVPAQVPAETEEPRGPLHVEGKPREEPQQAAEAEETRKLPERRTEAVLAASKRGAALPSATPPARKRRTGGGLASPARSSASLTEATAATAAERAPAQPSAPPAAHARPAGETAATAAKRRLVRDAPSASEDESQ